MSYLLKLTPPKLPRSSFLLSSHSLLSTTRHIVINIPLGPYCPPLELSSGQLARLADGCAVAKLGNTAVMSTVCRGKVSTSSFLPLTVDYRQKAAAAGRIPTNFLRRELGPSEREILTSRMIDRSVRPLAAKGFVEEVGISCNLLAVGVEDPEVLAINAASMALAMSSLPWQGAVGAVRVGWAGDRVLVNPARRELGASEVNLVVVGTSEGKCTMMEGEAKCVKDTRFLECVRIGLEYCAEIAGQIDMVGGREGKDKVRGGRVSGIPMDMMEDVRVLAKGRLRSLYTDYTLDKLGRDKMMFQIRDDIVSRTRRTHPDWEAAKISEAFSGVSSEMVRDLIFDENIRVDGRGLADIRPISCQVNLHHPLHGSALFQRGQTQVMCTTALDSLHSAMKLDPMTVITGGLKEKNFLLHYEFPSYATGEVGRGGAGANRREMGHGALAEKALKQVVPDNRQFTVRLTSEVLESNGSSSMASVCGGSLALLDAGVKLIEPASGVAMGLVTRGQEARVLTDIMGIEDFLGDMDFKLAATRSGVCAIQADVKINGIDYNTIKQAVEGAMDANHKILDIMDKCLDRPVESKPCWPVSKNISIPAHKRGKFLGPAGLNVKRISGETGVQIQPEEGGVWSLFAPSSAAMEEAEMMVEELLEGEKAPELVFGAIYTGKITELLDRGVMLSLHPAMDPVLLHNSQLAGGKVSHPSALGLAPGQDLQVKYYGRDPVTGQVRLSRKVLTVGAASAVKNLQTAIKRNDDRLDSDAAQIEELSSDNSQPVTKDSMQSTPSYSLGRKEFKDEVFNPVKYAQMLTNAKVGLEKEKGEFFSLTGGSMKNQSEPEPSTLLYPNNESELNTNPASKPGLIPSSILNHKSQSEEETPMSAEAKYYHIDLYINQLMSIQLELHETFLKRTSILEELEKVQQKVKFLTKPNSGNILLAEAFLKATRDKHRNLLSRIKAIDESLFSLKRQYDDTKKKVEQMKLGFVKAKETTSSENQQEKQIEILETPSLYQETEMTLDTNEEIKSLNLSKYKTFDPANLLSRDNWSLSKLSNFLTSVTPKEVPEESTDLKVNKELSNIDPSAPGETEECEDIISTRDIIRWHKDYHPPVPTEVLALCKPDQCNICRVKLNSGNAELHYQSKRHQKKVKKYLGKMKHNGNGKFLQMPRNPSLPTRENTLYDKEAEVRNLSDFFKQPPSPDNPWHTEFVTKFVERSVQDFQTLLKWLDELESAETWDGTAISNVSYGLSKIHKNLVTNIKEIEDNYKYQKYHAEGIQFISQYLMKPNQHLVLVANTTMKKMDEEYAKAVEELGKNVSIGQRLDQKLDNVWREYHEVRRQMKEVKNRLWEVETDEERLAELDDWRGEHGHTPENYGHHLQELCKKIDMQDKKVLKYTRLDLDLRWKEVDSDLKKLQLLRIQALQTWISEQQGGTRPHWLCCELEQYLVEACREYCRIEDSAYQGSSWVGIERDGDTDLVLEMAYSRVRGVLAGVKYGSIENKRHRRELQIYKQWLEDNRDRLRDSTSGQLTRLLGRAEGKVGEVDSKLADYVAVLYKGGDGAREAKEVLDTSRKAKRMVMKEAVQTIVHSWKGEGKSLTFVSYGGGT